MRRIGLVLGVLLACLPAAMSARAAEEVPQGSATEPGDPEARRKALNQEQAAKAQADIEAHRESLSAHEAAIATNRVRQERDDAAYAELVRRYDADVSAYSAARAEWERTNPACKRNDPVGCPR